MYELIMYEGGLGLFEVYCIVLSFFFFLNYIFEYRNFLVLNIVMYYSFSIIYMFV